MLYGSFSLASSIATAVGHSFHLFCRYTKYRIQLHFLLLSLIYVRFKLTNRKEKLSWNHPTHQVLYKRMALFIHSYVSSGLTFLMMRNSNFDLCMHEMCML